ncbi:MAG: nicotinate-nucleotide--dimethylbenzimidazole phosphoribosyltransferase [Myxococcales bacterium]|nr:nicotinate-nucleotide--dimethylbenzimidazole phosphoribosyltransferase [Myxococcales bacterium]
MTESELNAKLKSRVAAVQAADAGVAAETLARWDRKTKPPGSLGALETLVVRLCASAGRLDYRARQKAVVVMAADHGVAAEGVSAYPVEVTAQMVENFAAGGAAINALCRSVGARLLVADLGTLRPVMAPGVRDLRVAAGTENFTRGPAMTEAQALTAIERGAGLAEYLVDEGVELIGLGEMGIANTSAASAIVAALCGLSPLQAVGPGTGVDAEGRARKLQAVATALELHRPDPARPLSLLAAFGGFELAGLVGLMLGAAARRTPVVLDGFITGAAALVASALCPALGAHLMASHRSAEPAHDRVLERLGLSPLLQLDLRLGEGSGAALAMPLIDGALAAFHDMASFEEAGVSDSL